MAEKAKETVMEDILQLKTLVVEAISSGAFLYPLKVRLRSYGLYLVGLCMKWGEGER
jgi:hypothetical protein